jgi:hypothetical protein
VNLIKSGEGLKRTKTIKPLSSKEEFSGRLPSDLTCIISSPGPASPHCRFGFDRHHYSMKQFFQEIAFCMCTYLIGSISLKNSIIETDVYRKRKYTYICIHACDGQFKGMENELKSSNIHLFWGGVGLERMSWNSMDSWKS